MRKKHNKARSRYGLQVITLCISTALVLILLGMIVLSVFTARNLTNYVKENLVVTMMLDQDLTNPEAQRLCTRLQARPYIKSLTFISKDQALKEQTVAMGSDPSEFVGGDNPFLASIELTLKGDYANNDSINWISKELKAYPKVADITYQHELVENVNSTLSKISLVLLVLAGLLTFVSFSLINNTVRLGIYARRFSIHTMKLVGASWGFIRRPFIKQAIGVGIVAALLAIVVLAGCIYGLYRYQDNMLSIITWDVIAITGCAVMLFGISITAICAYISVNRFLRMKAGELYKI
ncbi:cell division protein FtsX [Hoylesella loescheii]|jgi:cell division protein ftsX|uniref:Cell division protein FtsX n=1 Tax=Hoylesella loescheii DSM 19665 = JCM 12249 = ATCC 15930 TaxID=1122985 RepID=A0A069QK03_HOYLO|nr:permease-like cell division protein FtsX [Hoylesella loescheii]KDR53163.1 efflux ABC transporter, permease protein [Hoylesella loescheii DSM 19665 = JCM 12249 = ATCC 15930]